MMEHRNLDSSNPDDLLVLVKSGLAWSTTEQAAQNAVRAIMDGTIPLTDEIRQNMPEQVQRYFEAQGK